MDRRVTPPKWVTSLTWGPPPSCKQALRKPFILRAQNLQYCDSLKKGTELPREGYRVFKLILISIYYLKILVIFDLIFNLSWIYSLSQQKPCTFLVQRHLFFLSIISMFHIDGIIASNERYSRLYELLFLN